MAQPFRDELARIKVEWERRAANANDAASLDAQATTDALAQLAKRVDAASTPEGAATAKPHRCEGGRRRQGLLRRDRGGAHGDRALRKLRRRPRAAAVG
ncbi:hypothetical protein AB5I41_09190 [Sphingomonas sp. MMS24-JH45]